MSPSKTTSSTKEDDFRGLKLTGLYLYNIGANLVGFATIVVLNLSTPITFFKINRVILFRAGGWHILFLSLFPLLVGVICLLQYRIQGPIIRVLAASQNNDRAPSPLQLRAKRRLLNLPFIIGFLNLMTYIIVSLLVSATFYVLEEVPLITSLFLFFRATMIGLIATGLSFFLHRTPGLRLRCAFGLPWAINRTMQPRWHGRSCPKWTKTPRSRKWSAKPSPATDPYRPAHTPHAPMARSSRVSCSDGKELAAVTCCFSCQDDLTAGAHSGAR